MSENENTTPVRNWNVPNQLTAMRLLLSIAVFVLIPLERYTAATTLFILAAATDWIDGYWARRYNQVTQLGRIFDPFVDKVLSLDEGVHLMTQTTLSAADHPFLLDHAIEGVPYHPGVMALEMFAQSSLLLQPTTCLAGFEEVSFGLPVKLLKGPMTVRVDAVVERTEDDMTWVRCRLISDLANSKGEVFGEREHHEALVRLVEKREDLRPFLHREVNSLLVLLRP